MMYGRIMESYFQPISMTKKINLRTYSFFPKQLIKNQVNNFISFEKLNK